MDKNTIRMVANLYSADNGRTWKISYVNEIKRNRMVLCFSDLLNKELELKGPDPNLDYHTKDGYTEEFG